MKFVIVGGGGYIGFHIGKDLKSKGHSVVLADISEPDPEWGHCDDAGPLVKTNILNRHALEEAFKGADCVIHCVSYGMSGSEQLDWDKTEAINIGGTRNVIEACATAGVRALVYTSTFNVVYGGQKIVNGTEEELPYFPLHRHVDHYSRTKAIAEQLVLTADRKDSTLRTCALRLAGVMGVGEKRHLPRIVNNLWMLKFTYGDPNSLVQFVFLENVVQAHVKAALGLLNSPQTVGGQAFFISDGVPINNFEFFRPLLQGLGYKFPTLNLPLCIMWIFSYASMWIPFIPLLTPAEVYKTGVTHYFSIAKAERLLGYEPTNPNDLSKVVQYYKERQRTQQNTTVQHSILSLQWVLSVSILLIAVLWFVWNLR